MDKIKNIWARRACSVLMTLLSIVCVVFITATFLVVSLTDLAFDGEFNSEGWRQYKIDVKVYAMLIRELWREQHV